MRGHPATCPITQPIFALECKNGAAGTCCKWRWHSVCFQLRRRRLSAERVVIDSHRDVDLEWLGEAFFLFFFLSYLQPAAQIQWHSVTSSQIHKHRFEQSSTSSDKIVFSMFSAQRSYPRRFHRTTSAPSNVSRPERPVVQLVPDVFLIRLQVIKNHK